jgi:DNA (cytosine-5)-methyltransferase 1
MSLGFEQAGFDVVAAVEVDPIHCVVHKFNFPGCAVVPLSVSQTTGMQIRKAAGIGNEPIDCVFGGPPCQGFSLIGHRSLEDPRNALVLDFVRLVKELKARTFVFENVKGLTVGRHRVFLDELVKAFDEAGYTVRLPWRVLDAACYGVPQHRQRLILMGSKKGTPPPNYPVEKFRAADRELSLLPPGPTCADALGDLPNADDYEALTDSDVVIAKKWGKPSEYAKDLRGLSNDFWKYGHPREWNPRELTSSSRTGHSTISQHRFRDTTPGEVEPISRFFRLAPKGLSNTLRAGTDGARGAFTSPRPIHYEFARCVTVREMARLHGFPDWFRLHATKWHGARQIGNAVPPPLAFAIASEVVKGLGVKPRRMSKAVRLGDPTFLTMELTEAARYLGVPVPNSKRDRKSGAKKRSQKETEAARIAALEANL